MSCSADQMDWRLWGRRWFPSPLSRSLEQANMNCVHWGLKQPPGSPVHCRPGYAVLMSPNKDETAVQGCRSKGKYSVRKRKVLAKPHRRTQRLRSSWSAVGNLGIACFVKPAQYGPKTTRLAKPRRWIARVNHCTFSFINKQRNAKRR